MKNMVTLRSIILSIALMLSLGSMSQVSGWRSPQQSPQRSFSSPSIQSRPQVQQRDNISQWRDYQPRNNQNPRNNGNTYIYGYPDYGLGWGWGWNRWDMWGAPGFGWNYWTPYSYYDSWGYRQPARIYIMEDGTRDTVYGKKTNIAFGLQRTTNSQIGAFFRAGNKGYFIAEFNSTFERDNSTFFPNGRLQNVDFPLVNDLVKRNSFYVGAGKKFKRLGVHFMVGSVGEVVRYRGKDDIGFITFPKYEDRFIGVKVGGFYDIKNLTIKADVDPVSLNTTFGLGVNF